MELSVIIPVYRTEEYLKDCVGSVLAQATEGVEVILVDDGSPDRCPQLCDEWMRTDSRVRVLHKENGGLSSARNAGLAIASGRYVMFVDSDDRVYPESIESILGWIKGEGADLCFLRAEKYYPDGTKTDLGEAISGAQLRGRSRKEAIAHLATRPKYPGSAWAKLYRRDYLTENHLRFPHDRRYSEDLGFIRDCILCAKSFDALEVPCYQYRQNRQGSITNQVTSRNFNDLLLFIQESVDVLTLEKKARDPISRLVMGFVAYEYSILLFLYDRIPEGEKGSCYHSLKAYRWVLRFAASRKVKLIALFCRVWGVKLTSVFMKQYRKSVEK